MKSNCCTFCIVILPFWRQPAPANHQKEQTMKPDRDLAWRSPLTIVLCLAGIAFLGLGMRTFFMPEAAAAYFGAPSGAPEALVFVKAYGARNIAIALLALTLVWLDQRRVLAALLALAALVAALDASVMFGYSGLAGAAKHLAYVAGLGGLALVTARGITPFKMTTGDIRR
jgi:hypothetical protein